MRRSLPFSRGRASPAPWRRRFRWLAVALLLYTLAGFFLLPALLRWQLVKRLPGLTHRQAVVQKVKFNPYALTLSIQGLALTETNGTPFAGWDELFVNFQLSSLFHRAWTFREIRLERPTATILRAASGQWNFANLGRPAPASAPAADETPKPPPAVRVGHLIVTNGVVTLADQTRARPMRLEVRPLNLDLQNLTTRRDENGQYTLTLRSADGGHWDWAGTLALNPPRSAGTFTVRGARLAAGAPYLAELTRAEIADGRLDASGEYRLAAEPALQLEITRATVKIEHLQLTEPGAGETLLALNQFDAGDASFHLAGRQVRLPRVEARGGAALLRRADDGQWNWARQLVARPPAPPASAAPAAAPVETHAPWEVAVAEFRLEDFAVVAEDHVPAPPARLGLDGLRIRATGFSTRPNAPLAATVEAKWRGGGTVRIEADGTVQPPAGTAKIALAGLALPPLQPYLARQLRLVLQSGELSLNGQARYAPGAAPAPRARFAGDLALAKFAVAETPGGRELAKWDELALRGIELAWHTNALNVDEARFQGLKASLVVNSNGQLNVTALSPAPPAAAPARAPATPPAAAAAPTPAAFPLRIGTLAFAQCSLQAADESLAPPVHARLEEFSGTIRNLALPVAGPAGVDLRGKISALAPFEITGDITPEAKNLQVDLKLSLKNSDLTPLAPYSEKYAGHPLHRGKLSCDAAYKVANRQLDARHAIVLDGLALGARNPAANAPNLPLKLAVALLKDRNGRITLDLPVSGNLDDPKFKLGAILGKTLSNLLLKVAASPFALLGAITGGGGEDLQYVDFPAGAATLAGPQTNKLARLARALYERPALGLEISASANAVTDREALTRQKLLARLKLARAEELAAAGQALPPPDELQLEPADYDRLLRKVCEAASPAAPENLPVLEDWAAAAAAPPAGPDAGAPAAARSSPATEKGALWLLRRLFSPSPPPPAPAAAPETADAPAAAPPAAAGLDRAEMEQRLMRALAATDDDLRELMRQRAQTVRQYLRDTGKVPADRLFLAPPQPVPPGTNGLARATFSLG